MSNDTASKIHFVLINKDDLKYCDMCHNETVLFNWVDWTFPVQEPKPQHITHNMLCATCWDKAEKES